MYVFLKRILCFTVLFSLGHSYYLCNRTGDIWDNAMEHCNRANGSLFTADNLEEIYILELMKTQNVTEFWTSNIIEVAYAVKYIGCYVYSVSEPQNHPISIKEEINLVHCQSACYGNYVISKLLYGLYNNQCTCIYDEQVHFSLSNQSCFKNCRINSLEFCKDPKLIALYKRISNDNTTLDQKANIVNNKCVAGVNATAKRENCQKNLQYQCKGSTQNGNFLNALENCGKELDRDYKHTNASEFSWRPVFFPTLDRIENQWDKKQKDFRMKICKSLKMEGNRIYLKDRNCTDSLPYICKTEGQETNTTYLKTCLFQIRQTSSPNMKTQLFLIRSDIQASTMPDTNVDTPKTTIDINYASTSSFITDTTLQYRSSTESADSGMSNKPLIIGIASAVAAMILAVTMTFIIRKRLRRKNKKNQDGLHTVNFQAVSDSMEEQDILNHQSAEPYSIAAPGNATLGSNQRTDVYSVVNKTKQKKNQNDEFYSFSTPVSSTSVQNKQKEGSGVNKNKKETENEEPQNNTKYDTNIDASKIICRSDDNLIMHTLYNDNNTYVESKRKPGNGVTYPLSSGTEDYDHIDFRGSGKKDELPETAGPLYDHVAVGENSAGLIYDVRRDVEQHETDDTYDHALSL